MKAKASDSRIDTLMNKMRPLEREKESDDFAERERKPKVLPKLKRVKTERRAVEMSARIVRFRMG